MQMSIERQRVACHKPVRSFRVPARIGECAGIGQLPLRNQGGIVKFMAARCRTGRAEDAGLHEFHRADARQLTITS